MDFLRQIVSGPKKRFQEDGYNLDLTYVCPRLIAMSFPASGIETLYRNSIDNVAKLIKNKHNSDYLIVNLSGRKYDYSKFQDKVLDYQWEDHHSPPINTLFVICQKIHQFLQKKKENVAIIHCLAGKGRTGTIICCYLLYTGRFETPEEALLYYGKKRFLQEGLGVNQPCQIRYVYYFHQILTEARVYPTLKYIKQVQLIGRPRFSDDGCRPFLEVFNVHSKEKLLSTMRAHSDQARFIEGDIFTIEIDNPLPISGDVLIRFKNNGAISNKNMFRFSFNTAFIKPDNVMEFGKSQLSPSEILVDQKIPKKFVIKVIFGDTCGCNCYTPFEKKCNACSLELDKESTAWRMIYTILNSYVKPTAEESTQLLFGKEPEDVDDILNKEKKTFVASHGELKRGKSSEEDRERLSNFNEYMYESLYKNNSKANIEPAVDQMAKNQSDSSSDEKKIKGITTVEQSKEEEKHGGEIINLSNSDEPKQVDEQRCRSDMSPNFYTTNPSHSKLGFLESSNVYVIYNNNAEVMQVYEEEQSTATNQPLQENTHEQQIIPQIEQPTDAAELNAGANAPSAAEDIK